MRLVRPFEVIGVGGCDFQKRFIMKETGAKLDRRYQRKIRWRVRADMPIETVRRNQSNSRSERWAAPDSKINVPVGNQRIFMSDLQYLVELHGENGVDYE